MSKRRKKTTPRSSRGCEVCGRKIGRRLREPKDLDSDGLLVCEDCRKDSR